MVDITDFKLDKISRTVSWRWSGNAICKTYSFQVRVANLLDDKTGVAVIEPFEEKGRDNAVVFNADGSERFRLKFPLPEPYGDCYVDIYYVLGRLTAFAIVRGSDFAYELDQETGSILKSYECR
jgi:hypothetical protein